MVITSHNPPHSMKKKISSKLLYVPIINFYFNVERAHEHVWVLEPNKNLLHTSNITQLKSDLHIKFPSFRSYQSREQKFFKNDLTKKSSEYIVTTLRR